MARKRKAERYRALVGLSYPTDPGILARIQAGERIPMAQRGLKEVQPGEVVSDIPETSLPWLLEQGLIELVEGDDGGL